MLEGEPVLPGFRLPVAEVFGWLKPDLLNATGPGADPHEPSRRDRRQDGLPKLRLGFDGGTLLVEGLPEGDTRGLPGLQFDPRTRPYRAEAIWYRPIVEHLRDRKIPYTDEARAYEQDALDDPDRQAGVPAPDRGPGRLVGRRRAGGGRPADGHGQDAPGQPRIAQGRAAHAWSSRRRST